MAFDAMVANRYLEQLSERDLTLLCAASGSLELAPEELRRHPDSLAVLLSSREVFEALMSNSREEALSSVSPFLVFALIVEQVVKDIGRSSYVAEWTGPGRRVPIFDSQRLLALSSSPELRLFLAELLASFTKVRSGSVIVRSGRRPGFRRQRFSELDPARLASLLEVVPAIERPGVYRRLGDLALFLTGIFPDHLARREFSSIERTRLVRSLPRPLELQRDVLERAEEDGPVEFLSRLGATWYRLAHDLVAPPLPRAVVLRLAADRFFDLRRFLGQASDRYLFKMGERWFGVP